jgi:F-type H+-transporting ATPase subunit delta
MTQAVRPTSVMSATTLSLADTYAEALLGALPEETSPEDVAEELGDLVTSLDEVLGVDELWTTSLLDPARRVAMIRRIFDGRVSEPVAAFLGVLARRGRLGLLRAAAQRFQRAINAREGKIEVTITTAVPLEDDQRKQIADSLGKAMDVDVVVHTQIDASLLGGMTVRVGDCVYDGSVAATLKQLARRLRKRVAGQLETSTADGG